MHQLELEKPMLLCLLCFRSLETIEKGITLKIIIIIIFFGFKDFIHENYIYIRDGTIDKDKFKIIYIAPMKALVAE